MDAVTENASLGAGEANMVAASAILAGSVMAVTTVAEGGTAQPA